MKIGVAAARPEVLASLRRAAESAGVEVAWTATTREELVSSSTQVALVIAAHGVELDAASCAREIAARGTPVVLAVADPSASLDSLYRVVGAGVEVAPLGGPDALVAIIARHRRAERRGTTTRAEAPVLAIAASAGGPDALAEVLAGVSRDLAVRVVVAQHLEASVAAGLASWLAGRSRRRVEVADEGRALDAEVTLVVRADRQPTIDGRGVVRYGPLDPQNPFHPCIDTLLESLARARALRGAAALLTGMGSDGAAGLLSLRRAGWTTIAQDAESSRVFGMPRAAALLGAAAHVVPLDRIGAIASRALRGEAGARA